MWQEHSIADHDTKEGKFIVDHFLLKSSTGQQDLKVFEKPSS
jgi:hypothetical protein